MRYMLAALLTLPLMQGSFFSTPLALEDMQNKQAVVKTSQGTIIIEFLPEVAPNHVGYFMKLASDGDFDGTTFHRMVLHGIIQGGDPISKDPEKGSLYGTGGLNHLKAEFNPEKHTRGAVSAVRLPGKNDSAGSQFFICVIDQPSLVHRVVPGFVIQTGKISTRSERPQDKAMKWIPDHLEPEFNSTPHVKGTVSMARADAPDSASTSFFICTAEASYLDGNYTAFGRVTDGIRVVEAIEALPTEGETPLTPIFVSRVRLERKEE